MPAVDASSPALSTGNGPGLTSPSFTPPAGSLLVAAIGLNYSSGTTALTATVASTPALTWTQRALRNAGDAGGQGGAAQISTAPVVTSQPYTVTATNSESAHVALKVFVLTGQAGSPIGSSGEGSSTTNNTTPTVITAVTGATSLIIVSATDWQALGAMASTDLTETGWHIASQISGLVGYETGPASGAVTSNLDAGSTGTPAINWVALEVLGATVAASSLLPDARRRALRPLLVR